MIAAIQSIDRFLKTLYRMEHTHWAEDFLLVLPKKGADSVGSSSKQGALLIDQGKEDLFLGIYLHPTVLLGLQDLDTWGQWSKEQSNVFSVACEEVSHFNYVAEHSALRKISKLELEIQAEVDKFVLAYFSSNPSQRVSGTFDALFESQFQDFALVEGLSAEEEERYLCANRQAKNLLKKYAGLFTEPQAHAELVAVLRSFYSVPLEKKLSLTNA